MQRVQIYPEDKNIVYIDTECIVGPVKDEQYQLSEMKTYWNKQVQGITMDPLMKNYDTFDEWLADCTRQGLVLGDEINVRTWRVYFEDSNQKLLEGPSISIILDYLGSKGYDVSKIWKVEEADR